MSRQRSRPGPGRGRSTRPWVPVRTSAGRRPRKTVLIVGEGEATERHYFEGLKKEDKVAERFTVTVKKGPGYSPEHVMDEAVNQKKHQEQRGAPYDEVWCVLDVEGPSNRASLDRALRKARRHDITVCLSNPAIEVWFLAHFVRTCRSFNDCEAVIQELNKYWLQVCPDPYHKADGAIYRRLSDKTDAAIRNARQVRESDHPEGQPTADCNSSTDVYRLVLHLLGGT